MRGVGSAPVWMAVALALACGEPTPAADPPPDSGDPRTEPDAGTSERPPPTTRERVPPPVTGGTLAIVDGDRLAVVADVDFDRIVGVDLSRRGVAWTVALGGGSHPFRIAEGPDAIVYVTLRATGEVVAIDARSGTELGRRRVCGSPRGVTWDGAAGLWHVACADGVLVSLGSVHDEPSRTLHLGVDLRDVVVDGEHTFVSRFRSAEVIVLDSSGAIVETMVPPPAIPRSTTSHSAGTTIDPDPDRTPDDLDVMVSFGPAMMPNSAYRMRPMPGGGVALLHQRSATTLVPLSATTEESEGRDGAYGGSSSCGTRLVHAAVTLLAPLRPPRTSHVIEEAVVPVDFAHDAAADTFVIVSAGGNMVFSAPVPGDDDSVYDDVAIPRCATSPPILTSRMPTAVATRADGRFVAFDRRMQQLLGSEGELARLAPAPLWPDDAFHQFFTRVGRAHMACATCHPEGGEDGHVWRFEGVGARRTQTTAGNIVETAPFHWSGDVPDMDVIVDTNMQRMGRSLAEGRASTASFENLLASLVSPAPPRPPDDDDAVAGRAIFETAGCADCHSGEIGTNNVTIDVGTGEPFQVPHLIGVAHRAPFFHDGCARTLRDVLDGCETHEPAAHVGVELTDTQKDALVAYLESR